MPPTLQQEIAAVRLTIEGATKKLAELEARPVVPPKWEPKGGRFIITPRGTVRDTNASIGRGILTDAINDGSAYPTQESAESFLPHITLYKRLACLAQELNPSGKASKNYGVYHTGTRWVCYITVGHGPRQFDGLFETTEAANKAVEIMNRDGWKFPIV